KALDDALVVPADRLEFGKCKMRLKTDIKPKEATFQVVLDVLALTPFYQAFLITAEFCPKIPRQKFEDLALEHDILSFIRDLGHSGDIIYLSDGMFYKKNIDYAYLLWEDFLFQIENKEAKKTNKMSYPRFIKIIIDYFMSKDQSISRRNKMFLHTARDNTMFTTIRCIFRHEDTQKADSDTSPKKKPVQATKGTRLKTKAKVAKSDKKKQHAKMPKAKGLDVLSKVALTEVERLKLATKRSKTQFHNSYASGSGDGVDTQSKVPDEQHLKMTGADKGTGTIPGIPDVPKYKIESKKESWGDSGEEDDEVTKELYDDVNVNLGNEDTDITNADQGASEQQNVSQESGFEQVEEDAHVTLTLFLDTQKADEPVQSSSVSFDFTSKLLNLENPSPADNEIASLMETSALHARTVLEITSGFTTTIPPPPLFFNPLPQQATPTPTLTTSEATTSFTYLPDFSFVFKFNDRVTNLEKDLS
ncbi:hypothetical protein Tco_0869096, partial [Tanacetum coccineum]